jgi:hypothetical protein
MKKAALQNSALEACKTIWQQVMAEIGAGRSAQQPLIELSTAIRTLRQTVGEAERLYEIALAAESASGGKSLAPKPAQPTGRLKKLPKKAERSEVIRNVAAKLAAENGGRVDLKGVAEAVIAEGYDLGTRMPGTMIGNVLNKSVSWKRLHKGAYEHVGKS